MTEIGKPVLFGDNGVDATIVNKFRHEHFMVRSLTRVLVAQRSLDSDIAEWTDPASGRTDDVIAWLHGRIQLEAEPTADDYRLYARGLAADLLFKICETMPPFTATRSNAQERWSTLDEKEYWRCVAICSAAWREAT